MVAIAVLIELPSIHFTKTEINEFSGSKLKYYKRIHNRAISFKLHLKSYGIHLFAYLALIKSNMTLICFCPTLR